MKNVVSGSPGDAHLRFGWWALLIYLALGGALETLHGFKVGWYLDAGQEMRRLMFTLGHAHGTLLALVNIAAGVTERCLPGVITGKVTPQCLLWSAVVLPVGFLLGGVVIHGGDPGIGIFLVPVGAVLLLVGVARLAMRVFHVTRA